MEAKVRIFIIRYRREIASVLAGFAVLLLISIIKSATPTIKAVVATSDLSAGTKISINQLTTILIPDSLSWPSLINDPDDLIGKITSHSIAAGAPIGGSDVISSDLLKGFDSKQIAISIPISTNRIDAYLTSGNHINVYAAQSGMPAKLVAYDAVVLFVPPNNFGGFQLQSSNENSLILAVDQGESADIAAFIGNGTFSFALLPIN